MAGKGINATIASIIAAGSLLGCRQSPDVKTTASTNAPPATNTVAVALSPLDKKVQEALDAAQAAHKTAYNLYNLQTMSHMSGDVPQEGLVSELSATLSSQFDKLTIILGTLGQDKALQTNMATFPRRPGVMGSHDVTIPASEVVKDAAGRVADARESFTKINTTNEGVARTELLRRVDNSLLIAAKSLARTLGNDLKGFGGEEQRVSPQER